MEIDVCLILWEWDERLYVKRWAHTKVSINVNSYCWFYYHVIYFVRLCQKPHQNTAQYALQMVFRTNAILRWRPLFSSMDAGLWIEVASCLWDWISGWSGWVSNCWRRGCSLLRTFFLGKSLVTQSCPTLCDPMDCSPPGSPVHGILHARTLEWVSHFSRGSSQPRNQTCISWVFCIGRQILYPKPPAKPFLRSQ